MWFVLSKFNVSLLALAFVQASKDIITEILKVVAFRMKNNNTSSVKSIGLD
jgi:hypothetical protein